MKASCYGEIVAEQSLQVEIYCVVLNRFVFKKQKMILFSSTDALRH